jgi:hypothetical protein
MRRWIITKKDAFDYAQCSTHRDRPAVAILQRPQKRGYGNVNLRFYCQECLDRKIARDPQIPIY